MDLLKSKTLKIYFKYYIQTQLVKASKSLHDKFFGKGINFVGIYMAFNTIGTSLELWQVHCNVLQMKRIVFFKKPLA